MILLPQQARDQHRESAQKQTVAAGGSALGAACQGRRGGADDAGGAGAGAERCDPGGFARRPRGALYV